MLVRIRYGLRAPAIETRTKTSEDKIQDGRTLERYALALASLLMPSALIAFTMAFWIMTSELRWTNEFFVPSGLLSHWQVWLFTAGVLLFLSRLLNRFAGATGS